MGQCCSTSDTDRTDAGHPRSTSPPSGPSTVAIAERNRMDRDSSVSPEQRISEKETRLADIDRDIRTTQITLEFAIETFDPSARELSDRKRELCSRQSLQEELAILRGPGL